MTTETAKPGSQFFSVTYIRTTPQKLWDALTQPEFTRAYWFGVVHECEWRTGAAWKLIFSDGRVADSGTLLECDPPRRLVISWRNEFRPELKEEGYSRATITLEPAGETVKLTILHEIDRDQSKLIDAVSGGWPMLVSSLKSLLETGSALEIPRKA
jgi:uncharacterized protein YndB with AHSA1/START domain